MTFDYEKLAERYKRSPAEIKVKVEQYASKIKEELKEFYKPDVIDAEVEKIVANNLSGLFQLKGLDYAKDQFERGNGVRKSNVIILGVSPAEDRNSYDKWLAREAYKMDPNGALAAKKVRLQKKDDGTSYPVALDSKATITRKNSDGSVIEEPNPNYGKDIPSNYKVSIPMIIAANVTMKDGKEVSDPCETFTMASMPYDRKEMENFPQVGKKSTVYGRVNGQYFSIGKDAYEGSDVYEKAYDVANRVLPSTEYWMDLAAIAEQPIVDVVDGKRKNIYTKFATKGTVQKVDVKEQTAYDGSKYFKASVRIGDVDVVDGIRLSTSYQPVVNDIDDGHTNDSTKITDNDEVIVFGCKKSYAKRNDDGSYVKDADGNTVMMPTYELWGIIKAFNAEHDAVLERLRAKGLL